MRTAILDNMDRDLPMNAGGSLGTTTESKTVLDLWGVPVRNDRRVAVNRSIATRAARRDGPNRERLESAPRCGAETDQRLTLLLRRQKLPLAIQIGPPLGCRREFSETLTKRPLDI